MKCHKDNSLRRARFYDTAPDKSKPEAAWRRGLVEELPRFHQKSSHFAQVHDQRGIPALIISHIYPICGQSIRTVLQRFLV